jgi:hypothetical protein
MSDVRDHCGRLGGFMTARLKGSKETMAFWTPASMDMTRSPVQCAIVQTNMTKLQGGNNSVTALAKLDYPEIPPGYGFQRDFHRMNLRLDTPTFPFDKASFSKTTYLPHTSLNLSISPSFPSLIFPHNQPYPPTSTDYQIPLRTK